MEFGYSKQVMEHFKKPKNMGKIENADGIGKVGNPICGDVMWVYIRVENDKGKEYIKDIKFQTMGCLPPTEKISLGNKWIEISNISKGDYILNSEAKKTKVRRVYENKFNGKLIYIIPFVSKFNSFFVTPTHPILSIKRKFLKSVRKYNKKCNWLKIKEEELNSTKPYYVESEYLEIGDYLIFPKIKKTKDNPKFTKALMMLLGYYLAEGYISPQRVINISLNKNEYKNINDVKNLFKKITGKIGSERIKDNVIELRLCSAEWARFFEKMCGKYARNKKLCDEILELPFEKQFEMIKTYIKGDGNLYRRRPKDSITYRIATASKQLAIQIQSMLTRGDIFSSIKEYKNPSSNINGRKIKGGTIFEISFKLTRKHKFVKETQKYFLIPIKKIERKRFKGKVYNLEVSGKNHSYLVKGFAVHNCIAAIATSSMITGLAKGKTLEEAKKINNKEIVKKLGGLPAIKYHCSLLGAQALHKAIEDYEKKKKS